MDYVTTVYIVYSLYVMQYSSVNCVHKNTFAHATRYFN